MLASIVSAALRLRFIVVILAVLLIGVGIRTLPSTQLDVFPEFAPPLVEIQTEAPGLSVTEVESLVTVPIENAMNGVAGLQTLRSKSVLGLSSVVLILQPGTDLPAARQLVQERLALAASRLPTAVKPPVMLSPLSSLSRVMKIGMTSKPLSQMDLSDAARWTIRPRLMAIPGVANVAIWGQRDRQLQVLVDPERLRLHNVSLTTVVNATRDAVVPETGGGVDTANQRLPVTNLPSVTTPSDLAVVPLTVTRAAANGPTPVQTPLKLGDVANLREGFPPPIGDAVINDGPGLLLIVEKQPRANTLDVTRKVEAALQDLKPGLKDIDIDATIFRPATFIERSLASLNHALLIGCVLVAVVLIIFLYDWRTAFISLTAIPLSLVAAGLALAWAGATVNTMVLAGLILALGEVVDDAVIDVENIQRRLRLNRLLENPEPSLTVVFKASLEVRSAIVYATLIVILVFLPVFLLDGLAGAFFRLLAVAYALAVASSLAVALTLTPALSLILLANASHRERESPLTRWLGKAYQKILPPIVNRPKTAMAGLLVAFVISGGAAARFGEELFPQFKETDFLMHWVGKPGTSPDAMSRSIRAVSAELRAIPGVRNFGSHIGRAEVADEVVGPNFAELWISVAPNVDYDATTAKIQTVVDGYPGLYRDVLTYLKERTKEVLSGSSGGVVVRLYGTDLDVLRAKAAEIQGVLKEVPGVTNLKLEPQVLVPSIEVGLKPEAAARCGLTAGEVRRTMATLLKGQKVGEIFTEQRACDVVVWGEPHLRTDIATLRDIRIATPLGGDIRLGDAVEIRMAPMPNIVQRENASRRIDVTCDVAGKDLGSVAREIEARVRKMEFPRGYHPEFLGEYAARQAARTRLLLFAGVSLIGILIVIYTDFKSAKLTALVAATLPFALVGGVFAVTLTGGIVSLGALIGFVTVLGIAARNGILLVSHYRHLETEESQTFGVDLILRGARERLSPILMTASVTGLALVPVVFGGVKPGQEIEYPMACVILGGLTTSTLLNLFLLPALYFYFGRLSPHGQSFSSETQAEI
jgi:CzcA family heavy metal efflux pump